MLRDVIEGLIFKWFYSLGKQISALNRNDNINFIKYTHRNIF